MMQLKEIFELCVWITKILTDIHRVIWAKIEESQTGSWFEAPISMNIREIHTKISNISPSVTSLMLFIIVEYYCGSRIQSIREPLGTQSPKPFPGTFLPKNFENFSQKKILFLANLDSASTPPHQHPHPTHQTWEFGILANLNSASKVGNWCPLTPDPPTLNMGILDFSKFELSIQSWKSVSTNPPPPTLNMGTLDFSKFELSIQSWILFPLTPPP